MLPCGTKLTRMPSTAGWGTQVLFMTWSSVSPVAGVASAGRSTISGTAE
ncbi:hypothetical protein M3G47_00400 [Corynebacterium sanguinis]|nr:hypothetical protein [Corynebacterium sanguinis]MCT2246558.1 hypothetical protein [Corynebacterium sanguinis]